MKRWVVLITLAACSGKDDGSGSGGGSGSASAKPDHLSFWWKQGIPNTKDIPSKPAPIKPLSRPGPDLVLGNPRLSGTGPVVVRDDQRVVARGVGSIVMYDLASGELVRQNPIESPAVIASSGRFAAEHRKDQIIVTKVDDGSVVAELATEAPPTAGLLYKRARVALSPDGTRLAHVAGDKVIVREVASGKVIATAPRGEPSQPTGDDPIPGPGEPQVELPSNDRLVVWLSRTGNRDLTGEVVVWDIPGNREVTRVKVRSHHRVDGGWLAETHADRSTHWNQNVLDGVKAASPFAIVAVDAQRTHAAVDGGDRYLRVFTARNDWQPIIPLAKELVVYAMVEAAFSPDGRWLAFADGGAIRVVDTKERVVLDHGARILDEIDGVVLAGEDLVVLSKEATYRFASTTGAPKGGRVTHDLAVKWLSIGPSLIGKAGTEVFELDLAANKRTTFRAPGAGYTEAGYDRATKRLMLGSQATIASYDEEGKPTYAQVGSDGLAWVANSGTIAASVVQDGKQIVLLHDGAPGKTTKLPDPPCARITGAAFSTSGDALAVATQSGHVRIWNTKTRKSRTLAAPAGMGWLAVAPGGDAAVGGSENLLWIGTKAGSTMVERPAAVHTIDVLADGRISVVLADHTVEIWKPEALAAAGKPVADPGALPACRR